MVKATKTEENAQYVRYRVEGVIDNYSSLCIEEILNEHINENARKVLLDFSEVSFISDNFLKKIKEIRSEKLVIVNCSPFLRELIAINSSQENLK